MSIEAVDYVFQNSKVTGNARLLMVAIASHATAKGYAYPGRERLTKYVRVQSRRITDLIKQCEWAGELAVIERPGKSNEYYILGLSGQIEKARPHAEKPKARKLPLKNKPTPATGDSTATRDTPATGINTTPATGDSTPLQPVAHEPSFKGHLNQKDTSAPTIPDASDALLRHYEKTLGPLTPGLVMQLSRLSFEYYEAWVKEALTITEDKASAPSLKYAEGILKRWRTEGKAIPGAPKPRKPDTIAPEPHIPTPEERAEISKLMRELKPDFSAKAGA